MKILTIVIVHNRHHLLKKVIICQKMILLVINAMMLIRLSLQLQVVRYVRPTILTDIIAIVRACISCLASLPIRRIFFDYIVPW